MIEQMKNVMIALFTLAAFAIIIFIIMFLHPNIGDEAQVLHVRFVDIDKINNGTRVSFGGKPVGEVTAIREILSEDGQRIEYNGLIYIYELTLALDSDIDVYVTDQITARTSGLLGEKSVSIMPIPAKKGQQLVRATPTSVLYAEEVGSIESTLRELKDVTGKVEIALDGFINAFDILEKKRTWENVAEAVENVKNITAALNQPENLADTVSNIADVSRDAKELFAAIDQPEKLSEFIDNALVASREFRGVATNMSEGRGTVGKLFSKDDFYLRLSSLMSKAETVLDDVNHYGVLFHLDNGWKRLRARRLNLLQELRYPQEFRNYFNDEIDSINTSLARVGMIIEKTDELCPCRELWQNPEYVKVYSELLRRVAMLEEYLQMYNQQVMDSQVKLTEFYECVCE